MAVCRFDSPSLITSISGTTATPTFAFDRTNSAYFGLSGQFTSNSGGAVCSFPVRSVGPEGTWTHAITPVFVTSSGFFGRATTCSILQPASFDPTATELTTYTGIECPAATNNAFLPGTYTLKFLQDGGYDIASQVFLVASPTFAIDATTTKTYTETVTFPVQTTSTATSTKYTSTATWTATRPLSTVTTTIPITVTRTVTSCSSTTKKTSTQPTPTGITSPDGSCGGADGYICNPGDCCSEYGYCGRTDAYCSDGCQPKFGTCSLPDPSQPSPTLKVSRNGNCGQKSAQTCRGSTFGNCCSQYGYCGSTPAYCAEGCQSQYGLCDASQKRSAARIDVYEKRNLDVVQRAIGGKGPDYTYPPIPHSTLTVNVTGTVLVFPSPVAGTTTVGGVVTTTVGGVVTVTQSNPVATRTSVVLCNQ